MMLKPNPRKGVGPVMMGLGKYRERRVKKKESKRQGEARFGVSNASLFFCPPLSR